jgi:hypothetical protein
MIRSLAYTIVLVLIVAGCSKNDNPAGPSGGSATQQFIFVNPLTGNDGNSGTQDTPVKTIHRALALFKPGIRIELQAGTYNAANGQVFPDSLPSGVVIESVSAGQAVLVGTIGDLAFYAAGTDTFKYVQFQGFNTCIRAGSGSHVLLGVGLTTIIKAFDIYGVAEGILQAGTGTSAVIATAKEFSRIIIKDCVLSGGTSNLALVTLSNAARAAITGTTIKDSPTTVLEIGDATVAEVTSCTFSNTGLHGYGSSAAASLRGTASLTVVGSIITDTYGSAITMESQTAVLTLKRVQFARNAMNGVGAGALYLYGSASLDSCSLANNGQYGLVLSQGNFVLRHCDISGASSHGIYVAGGASLTMRSSTVSYSGIGVLLAASNSLANLGTAADPGRNTFQNNTKYGLESDVTGNGSAVLAVGNTWTPNVQAADANGYYATATVSGPTPATQPENYYITGAGRSIQF